MCDKSPRKEHANCNESSSLPRRQTWVPERLYLDLRLHYMSTIPSAPWCIQMRSSSSCRYRKWRRRTCFQRKSHHIGRRIQSKNLGCYNRSARSQGCQVEPRKDLHSRWIPLCCSCFATTHCQQETSIHFDQTQLVCTHHQRSNWASCLQSKKMTPNLWLFQCAARRTQREFPWKA